MEWTILNSIQLCNSKWLWRQTLRTTQSLKVGKCFISDLILLIEVILRFTDANHHTHSHRSIITKTSKRRKVPSAILSHRNQQKHFCYIMYYLIDHIKYVRSSCSLIRNNLVYLHCTLTDITKMTRFLDMYWKGKGFTDKWHQVHS